MGSSYQTPDSEGISMQSTGNTSLQRSWLAVASLIGTLSGLALAVPAWIFARRASDLAQEINSRAYALNTSGTGNTTYNTSNPGQIPALAERYAHYQQASTLPRSVSCSAGS